MSKQSPENHPDAAPPGTQWGCLEKKLPALVREAVREEMQIAQKQPDGGQLLTKEDVAGWLQVSPRTVDTLAASGELKKIKVRKCVRFSPGAVEAYIRQRAEGGSNA